MQDKRVSVLGSHYLPAVAGLIDALKALPDPQLDDDLPPGKEAGLSASICILMTVAFESWVRKLILMESSGSTRPRLHPLEFLGAKYRQFPHLPAMYEVFVVRDLLVHNHVWEIDLTADDSYNISVESASLAHGGTDSKYRRVVDSSTRVTKLLKLHVMPTQVDRSDAAVVVRNVWDSMLWLQGDTPMAMHVDHYALVREGGKLYFATYVNELEQDAQRRAADRSGRS